MSKENEYSFKLTQGYEGAFVPFALAVWLMTGIFPNEEQEAKTGNALAMLRQSGDTWLLTAIHASEVYKHTLLHAEALAETGETGDLHFIQFLGAQFLHEVGGLIGLGQLRAKYLAEEKAEFTTAFINEGNTGVDTNETATGDDVLPQGLKDLLAGLGKNPEDVKVHTIHATMNKDGEIEFEGGALPEGGGEKMALVRDLIKQLHTLKDLRKRADALTK